MKNNKRNYIKRKYYVSIVFEQEIIDNNDITSTESLKISNMFKNHHIAKKVQDASLSEIIRQLIYKAKWTFKKIYQIDTFYPSSHIVTKKMK